MKLYSETDTNVLQRMYNLDGYEEELSGSGETTKGTITSGSNQILVEDIKDFKVGQGIYVAGAGANTREILTLVIEEQAKDSGTFTYKLPNESTRTVSVSAVKEKNQIQITEGATISGNIHLILNAVEHIIPVTAEESAVQIADKIRAWYFEGWETGGIAGTDIVTLTATVAGKRWGTVLHGVGTGVSATITRIQEGTLKQPHDIAQEIREEKYTNWTTAKEYSYSNVVFFIANTNGVKKSLDSMYIDTGTTEIKSRFEVVQHGRYLVSKIAAIDGNKITIEHKSSYTEMGVFVSHDDTAALTKKLENVGSEVVRLQKGVYRISDTLRPLGGSSIIGSGKQSTLIQMQRVGRHGIEISDGMNDVYIGHLQIKNICSPDNPNDSERHAIKINHSEDVVVEHCLIDNADDAGIRVGYSSMGNSRNTKLLYNTILNTAEGSGIEIIRGERCLVLGNKVMNSSQHGIRLCGSIAPIVMSNYFEHNKDHVSIQGFTNGHECIQRVTDFIVEANYIGIALLNGISVFNQGNTGTVKNNRIIGGTQKEVIKISHNSLPNGRNSTPFEIKFEGNMITGGQRPITIRGDQHTIIFKGNTIKDYWAEGTESAYAIYLDTHGEGDLRNIILENNEIISRAKDKFGIRIFRASENSKIIAHHNIFMIRTLSPSTIASRALRNHSTGGYNVNALIHTKKGTGMITHPDQTNSTITVDTDTNEYIVLPV